MESKKVIGTACAKVSSRYTDWRPNLLHGMSTAVFVGSRTVDSLLPPAFDELTSVEIGTVSVVVER